MDGAALTVESGQRHFQDTIENIFYFGNAGNSFRYIEHCFERQTNALLGACLLCDIAKGADEPYLFLRLIQHGSDIYLYHSLDAITPDGHESFTPNAFTFEGARNREFIIRKRLPMHRAGWVTIEKRL